MNKTKLQKIGMVLVYIWAFVVIVSLVYQPIQEVLINIHT